MIYHDLAKFDGPRHRSSRDMFLVRHVIKQDHGIKGSGDYNDKNPFKLSHHPASFGGHRLCSSGDIMVLVCLVI